MLQFKTNETLAGTEFKLDWFDPKYSFEAAVEWIEIAYVLPSDKPLAPTTEPILKGKLTRRFLIRQIGAF